MTPDLALHWSRWTFWAEEMPWLRLGLYLFLSTVVLGSLGSYLREHRAWKDGDTRKLSHFGHMAIATPLLVFLPPVQLIPAAILGTVAVIVIYGLAATSTRPRVYAIVAASFREQDRPRARFHFFFPLVSGNVALVLAALLFPVDAVRVAFFTCAIADGLAEPVGLRFGEGNRYQVRDLIWGSANTKSLAGSAAVFLAASAIAMIFFRIGGIAGAAVVAASLAYGLIIAAIEALSPRGFDNMLLLFLAPVVIIGLGRLVGV